MTWQAARSGFYEGQCLGDGQAVVDDAHEGLGDAGWVGVLDNVAAVNDAGGPLRQEVVRALGDFAVADFATAAHEHRNAAGGLDHLMIAAHIVGGVGLDDVGAEFDGLPDERDDFFLVAVDHVAAGLFVRLEDERLDHHRHSGAPGDGFEAEDVLHTLFADLGFAGDLKQVHAHARGVETERLLDRFVYHAAVKRARKFLAVNVGDVDTQHERGFEAPRQGLEMSCLAGAQLDRIGRGGHDDRDGAPDVFNAFVEGELVAKTMIDRDIKAAPGQGMKETVETVGSHWWWVASRDSPNSRASRAR